MQGWVRKMMVRTVKNAMFVAVLQRNDHLADVKLGSGFTESMSRYA